MTSNCHLSVQQTRRNLENETRPRLAIAHVTYVDPGYLATGGRVHDAWTSGDHHLLPYQPRVVVVVENRDSRVWFPPFPGVVAVEGGGKAAAALLAGVEWILNAERVVYWGDLDTEGFGILAHFRAALAQRGAVVESILMDAVTMARFAHLGVNHDKHGQPLKPQLTSPGGLHEAERGAYEALATGGPAVFRRIEQERIGSRAAAVALEGLLQRTLTSD